MTERIQTDDPEFSEFVTGVNNLLDSAGSLAVGRTFEPTDATQQILEDLMELENPASGQPIQGNLHAPFMYFFREHRFSDGRTSLIQVNIGLLSFFDYVRFRGVYRGLETVGVTSTRGRADRVTLVVDPLRTNAEFRNRQGLSQAFTEAELRNPFGSFNKKYPDHQLRLPIEGITKIGALATKKDARKT